MIKTYVILLLVCPFIYVNLSAQNSAPSQHMYYNGSYNSDILINEVRVPIDPGPINNTYYEALGWRGNAAGYGGIQKRSGDYPYIYSIWDNNSHRGPITEVHVAHGTYTTGFGGEGTGLKSFNTKLGWEPGYWYTLFTRSWSVGNNTHVGYWVRDGVSGIWRHLVTMAVQVSNATFNGSNDSFLEDWASGGSARRETNIRNGWYRERGNWHAAQSARYSVNGNDLGQGGRSYNYRTAWDGGVKEDETGKYYYMVAGGSEITTRPNNPSTFNIPVAATKPNFSEATIKAWNLELTSTSLNVTWDLDSTGLPQFKYLLEIYSNSDFTGSALFSESKNEPDVRRANISLSSNNIDVNSNVYYARLTVTDIMDNVSSPLSSPFGNGVTSLKKSEILNASFKVSLTGKNDLLFSGLKDQRATISLISIEGKQKVIHRGLLSVEKISVYQPGGLYLVKVETEKGKFISKIYL